MRAIDSYTPAEIDMLRLKNMLPEREWNEQAERDNDLRHESRLSDWLERNPSPESEAQ